MNEKEPTFLGYWHIRYKNGLEVIGSMYQIEVLEENKTVLFKPVRVVYSSVDGIGVTFSPLSLFSDEQFYIIDQVETDFMVELNERSVYRYETFITEFENAMNEIHEDDEYSYKSDTIH